VPADRLNSMLDIAEGARVSFEAAAEAAQILERAEYSSRKDVCP
jgi:hypothetical protein